MQLLEVSGAIRHIYGSLGIKRLTIPGTDKGSIKRRWWTTCGNQIPNKQWRIP